MFANQVQSKKTTVHMRQQQLHTGCKASRAKKKKTRNKKGYSEEAFSFQILMGEQQFQNDILFNGPNCTTFSPRTGGKSCLPMNQRLNLQLHSCSWSAHVSGLHECCTQQCIQTNMMVQIFTCGKVDLFHSW